MLVYLLIKVFGAERRSQFLTAQLLEGSWRVIVNERRNSLARLQRGAYRIHNREKDGLNCRGRQGAILLAAILPADRRRRGASIFSFCRYHPPIELVFDDQPRG